VEGHRGRWSGVGGRPCLGVVRRAGVLSQLAGRRTGDKSVQGGVRSPAWGGRCVFIQWRGRRIRCQTADWGAMRAKSKRS